MTRAYRRRERHERTAYQRLILDVAAAEGITQALARAVLEQFVAQLPRAVWELRGLSIPGLGSFRVRVRKLTTAFGVTVPERRVVHCRVASSWRAR